MKKFLFFGLFIYFLFVTNLSAQRDSRFIAPQTTDSAITTNLNNHYVSINNSVAAKNQLFVFLPGSGAVAFNYLEINRTAADLGFHSINLTYPNDQPVNSLCSLTANLDCYSNVRLETKDGTDRTPLVSVNRSNSIENRLIKLLIYLRTQFPSENWGQFLLNETTVDWSKIIISGHSQGGGHAGIIGRYHSVVRVVMFAAMDFNGMANAPATWISQPNTTPNASSADKFWGFSHQRDDLVNFQILSGTVWTAFGMPQFGSIVNVDNINPPYNNTHSLTTNLDCTETHGCIAGDVRLIRLPNGTPIYKPVWEYLLSNTTSNPNLSAVSFLRRGTPVNNLFPGVSTKFYKINLLGNGFNSLSKAIINDVEVETQFISETELRVSLPAGVVRRIGTSILKVRNSDGSQSNSLNF